jgi:transposase
LQKTLEARQLVFLDECGINLVLTRLYGWGEKHVRVEDYVPDARFERSSILSAVRLSGVEASVSFSGSLNVDVFALYVKYVLAPALNAGDVVLLDNLSSHRVEGALDPIFDCGAFVWFLSVCSPDLNSIELMWSKVKAVLRWLKVRSWEDLQKALKTALATITLGDISGWFKHDGYI